MPEEKKRFPWWLLGCAVALVLLAAVVGFIETVGRERTIIGRFDKLEVGMPETKVEAILGRADLEQSGSYWHEGPVDVEVVWQTEWKDDEPQGRRVARKSYRVESGGYALWRIRRWAEQAYTAIHGPRR